ncbi:type III-B CRISPR module-associated protein Cmr5 [Saccharibacillus sp. CPCC 101409]|uniref:type III-B CRISPR module-associated protein Cmr5 n=1 Tax=Saccharibacillus sp. CPCC 101409 TaxID=3058041 RepID=UPI002670EA44|nr:type III-B CRISPR module-associated protein Cmr5 [Saccharibacillus sp. CPCC 101409]MDO3411204.1 type III-B CRISPR module-associated protein Cmr5 [Saccharibacillus sp. CPCC 101409]
MQSAQQRHAEAAYKGINEARAQAKSQGQAFEAAYGQLCHRFPSLVMTNGLRLAFAFFKAKGESSNTAAAQAYRLYLKNMGEAVKQDWQNAKNISAESADYLALSREVLSASVWFKRYAEAILNVEQGTDELALEEIQ